MEFITNTMSNKTNYSGVIVSSMSDKEYKKYIHYILNRIIEEKLFIIEEKYKDNKVVFSIKLKRAEWYLELEDDVKYDVEENLKTHIIRQIQSTEEFEELNTTLIDNSITINDISNNTGSNTILCENIDQKNKRQRVNI